VAAAVADLMEEVKDILVVLEAAADIHTLDPKLRDYNHLQHLVDMEMVVEQEIRVVPNGAAVAAAELVPQALMEQQILVGQAVLEFNLILLE
jgi:predicted RNA methylase